MLTGYMYSAGAEPRGILVIAHGLGAGHNSYMDCANFFAHNGYLVFAYDATACDESEGDGLGGIPQGVVDLDRAISFVEESGHFPDLPIVLFGHSWGGYSACSVLTVHPEVKAVIECSGCNRSSDLFEAGGKEEAGDFIYAMMPFVKLHERLRYGKYAANTAMDGFAASDAAVMIVHSEDDGVVPIEYAVVRIVDAPEAVRPQANAIRILNITLHIRDVLGEKDSCFAFLTRDHFFYPFVVGDFREGIQSEEVASVEGDIAAKVAEPFPHL